MHTACTPQHAAGRPHNCPQRSAQQAAPTAHSALPTPAPGIRQGAKHPPLHISFRQAAGTTAVCSSVTAVNATCMPPHHHMNSSEESGGGQPASGLADTHPNVLLRHCGVQPFYIPRSNPNGYAVTMFCIKPGTVRTIQVKQFNGRDWEASYAATGISCLSESAPPIDRGTS
jgi:hypothetical protein